MSSNQYAINPETHPADAALAREHEAGKPSLQMSADELLSLANTNPADVVVGLHSGNVSDVPKDSAAWQMSTQELRANVQAGLQAAQDLRKLQSEAAYADQTNRTFELYPSGAGAKESMTATMRANKAGVDAARSARQVLSQAEFDATVRQLQQGPHDGVLEQQPKNPDAPDYQLNDLGNGTFELLQETGEKFRGTLPEIVAQQAKQHVHDKKWVRGIREENARLKSGQPPQPQQQSEQQPITDPAGLITDPEIAEKFARSVGFSDAQEMVSEWQAMQTAVKDAGEFAEKYRDEQVAETFIAQNPDFPGDQHAIAELMKVMDASDLDYSKPENLSLAHQYAVKRGFYQPLTQDDIEASTRGNASQRTAPPMPPSGSSPDFDRRDVNPWAMATDELRRKVLEGGGLGKALLEMQPGTSLGGQ